MQTCPETHSESGVNIKNITNVLPVTLCGRFQDLAKKVFFPSLSNLQNELELKCRICSENFRILEQLKRYVCYQTSIHLQFVTLSVSI